MLHAFVQIPQSTESDITVVPLSKGGFCGKNNGLSHLSVPFRRTTGESSGRCQKTRLPFRASIPHCACEHELREGDNTEATAQLEARIAATLANMAKEVQSLFTLAHTQFALTNSLLQYVLTCMVEPPEEVLPAARTRARLRYAKILRLAAEEVTTRNKATLQEVLTCGKQQ